MTKPTPTSRRQAGAVNTNWLIVIMILWLGTLYLLYVTNDSIATADQRTQAALQERAEWETRWDSLNEQFTNVSKVAGFTDGTPNAKSDVTAMRTQLDTVKGSLGATLGEANVTLDGAVTKLLAEVQAARAAVSSAKADFEKERAARQAAESRTSQIESNYKSQVDSLSAQLADAQDAASRQADNDQGRIDDITDENTRLDADKRSAERALADAEEEMRRATANYEALIASLADHRQPIEPEQPDGELISVSDTGDVAWIDVGGRDGLKAGTRFELLRRGKSGQLVSRGKVEVRSVSSDTAMVGLLGEPNAFDPILPGDLIRNPHFSRNRTLHFFLLGDFPLTMSKEFATQRLEELGAEVDGAVSPTTDVLVVGEKSLAAGEDAPDLVDTDEYRRAEQLGIRIIRLPELEAFLRY